MTPPPFGSFPKKHPVWEIRSPLRAMAKKTWRKFQGCFPKCSFRILVRLLCWSLLAPAGGIEQLLVCVWANICYIIIIRPDNTLADTESHQSWGKYTCCHDCLWGWMCATFQKNMFPTKSQIQLVDFFKQGLVPSPQLGSTLEIWSFWASDCLA